MPAAYAPDVRERARRMIFEDEYTIAETARTLGVDRKTVGYWFPGAPRMDARERSEWANLCRRYTFVLSVDPKLLDHTEHLPETVSCSCGYVRPEVAA